VTERLGVHACSAPFWRYVRSSPASLASSVRANDSSAGFCIAAAGVFCSDRIHTEFRDLGGKNVLFWFLVLLRSPLRKSGGTYYGARKSNLRRGSRYCWASDEYPRLIDLVVVNLALQAGAINTQLFTILVLVALITTAMTAPALKLLRKKTEFPDADDRVERITVAIKLQLPAATHDEAGTRRPRDDFSVAKTSLTGICEVPTYAKSLAPAPDVAVDCVANQCAGCGRCL